MGWWGHPPPDGQFLVGVATDRPLVDPPLCQGSERRPIKNLRARASKVCRNGTCMTRPRNKCHDCLIPGQYGLHGEMWLVTSKHVQMSMFAAGQREYKTLDVGQKISRFVFFCLLSQDASETISLSWQGTSFTSSCNCDVRSSKQFLARRSFCMSQTSENSEQRGNHSIKRVKGILGKTQIHSKLHRFGKLARALMEARLENIPDVWWQDGMSALQCL